MHKVHRPTLIHLLGHLQRYGVSAGYTFLTSSSLVQTERTVNPVYAFVVEAMPPSTNDLEQLSKAMNRISFNGKLQHTNHLIVSGSVWSVSKNRTANTNDATCSTNADLMFCSYIVHQVTSNRWLYSFFSTTSFNIL